ncbi:MAG: AtpZ/AtpI family protein [Candidatus Limnocylindrales bacterium]
MWNLGNASIYLALFSEIAIAFGLTVLAGVLGGWWIDQQLHTLPVFLLLGALGGLALGGLAVGRLISRFLARIESKN